VLLVLMVLMGNDAGKKWEWNGMKEEETEEREKTQWEGREGIKASVDRETAAWVTLARAHATRRYHGRHISRRKVSYRQAQMKTWMHVNRHCDLAVSHRQAWIECRRRC
jgi:hypothetical protein